MDDHGRVKHAFENTPSVFKLLSTLRTRRVGLGYRIDSDTEIEHPVTGRKMRQEDGPMKYVSEKKPVRLTDVEEALLCWVGAGPSGLVAWDISMLGGFHELTWISGRTTPGGGNSHATDLLVINDDGAFIYKPPKERSKPVEIETEEDLEKIVGWYDDHMIQILDERPDIDYALRAPGAPHATLMGPYQFNINMPGSTWLIPLTDAAWLNSAMLNFFDFWHMYMIDEWNGDRPAGVEKWIGEGKLELPTTIAAEEQLIFQLEMYPAGMMVQNIRLAAEAMGLGCWNFCGFNPDVLFGAMPEVSRGLGFHVEAPNAKAPVSTGQVKVFGVEGVKEATYVPSPRYKNGEQLVQDWMKEKYGPGGVLNDGPEGYLRQTGSPWNSKTTDEILKHPRTKPADWVPEAVAAYVDYCVENFGQWPVTYNPMQAHFGVVIHNLDVDYYEKFYRDAFPITDAIRNRSKVWHD